MPLETPPPAIADPALPLPSLADRASYGPRRREWLRWEHEDLAPGMQAFSLNAYANAVFAKYMAEMAAAIDNYAGNWAALTGALNVPAAVYHDDEYWVLLSNIADVTAEEPGVSSVWTTFEDGAVQRIGDTMTGHLNVPAGATGTQAPRASEVMSIVGGAQMPTWNTAGRPGSPSTGRFGYNTDLTCIEHWNGTHWVQEGWQSSGLINLTSTHVDQVVPPWARELSIELFDSASTSASSYVVQLGTSGGIVSTNYNSFSSRFGASVVAGGSFSTSGFLILAESTAAVNGTLNLRRSSGNLWSSGQGGFARTSNASMSLSGNVDIGGAISTVRILRTAGAGTWTGMAYVNWRK